MPASQITETTDEFLDRILTTGVDYGREEWVVWLVNAAPYTLYWTGADWNASVEVAAHFCGMTRAMAVVRMLEHFTVIGKVQCLPLADASK